MTNGSGTATTANISNVVVTCSNQTFNVGGTISGLTAAGLVLANGSDTLSVPAGATSFTMPTAIAHGSDYKVTVTAQPTGLTCDVANGTGTVAGGRRHEHSGHLHRSGVLARWKHQRPRAGDGPGSR